MYERTHVIDSGSTLIFVIVFAAALHLTAVCRSCTFARTHVIDRVLIYMYVFDCKNVTAVCRSCMFARISLWAAWTHP